MRFQLLEEPIARDGIKARKAVTNTLKSWPPPLQMIDQFAKLKKNDDQVEFIESRIIPSTVFKPIFGLRPIVIECMIQYGLDPKKNKFLPLLIKIGQTKGMKFTNREKRPHIRYVYDSWKNKKLNILSPILSQVLLNPSLYDRSEKDFRYTMNVFNMLSQDSGKRAYFKNPDVVDLKQLLVNESKNFATDPIIPAGIRGGKGRTIYNVIEQWSEDNEFSPEEIAQNKAKEAENTDDKVDSIHIQWTYPFFKDVIEKVFANRTKFKLKFGTQEDYLSRLYYALSVPKLKPGNIDNNVIPLANMNDTYVKKFGDVSKVDTPIYVTLEEGGNKLTPGAYLFHKFVSLDDDDIKTYVNDSKNSLTSMKNTIYDIDPTDMKSKEDHFQSIIDVIQTLPELPTM